MRVWILAAALVLVPLGEAWAQVCSGVRNGAILHALAGRQDGGWQADGDWVADARAISIRGIAGRVHLEASDAELERLFGTDPATGRSLGAAYYQPLVRVEGLGAIACLRVGAELGETVIEEVTTREVMIPVGFAWGIDIFPRSPVSFLPHAEAGFYARQLDGWGGGGYVTGGVTARFAFLAVTVSARQRLRSTNVLRQVSAGLMP